MALIGIQFTQEQVRSLSNMSLGDLRHWRKSIPYLAKKSGKASRFTFADIIGLCVVSELVHFYRIHVTDAAVGIDSLFQKLNAARPASLSGLVAILRRDDAQLILAEDFRVSRLDSPAICVPIDPLIDSARGRMLPFPQVEQAPLPFPPKAIRN